MEKENTEHIEKELRGIWEGFGDKYAGLKGTNRQDYWRRSR